MILFIVNNRSSIIQLISFDRTWKRATVTGSFNISVGIFASHTRKFLVTRKSIQLFFPWIKTKYCNKPTCHTGTRFQGNCAHLAWNFQGRETIRWQCLLLFEIIKFRLPYTKIIIRIKCCWHTTSLSSLNHP